MDLAERMTNAGRMTFDQRKCWALAMRQLQHAEDNLRRSGDGRAEQLLHSVSHLLVMEGTGRNNTARITKLAGSYQVRGRYVAKD